MTAKQIALRTAVSIVSLALVVSCASMREVAYSGSEGSGQKEAIPSDAARSSAPTSRSSKSAPAVQEVAANAPSPSARGATRPDTEAVVAPGKNPIPPAQNQQERKRVYEAKVELLVASVERARADIIEQAQAADGYVESSVKDTVIIRVPAARFDEVLATVQGLGDVRSRQVEATDVTDQYADLSLRLKTATASRARLYELLEQAKKSDERLAILREIRRLTEEIEQLSSSLNTLGRLIEFSRITVRLLPRIQAQQVTRSAIPFKWIAALDPLKITTRNLGKSIEITLPKDFAVFSKDRFVRAEAADGTRIRIGSVANDPKGDTTFWETALSFHLAKYYARTQSLEAGSFHGAGFVSRDAKPYVYAVLVAVKEDEIVVVEAYLPNEGIAQERLTSLRAMLEGAAL